MSKVMYKVSTWLAARIEKREILRETEKTVWYKTERGNESQERKQTTDSSYFDSFEEAKEYAQEQAIKKVKLTHDRYLFASKALKEIEGMEE